MNATLYSAITPQIQTVILLLLQTNGNAFDKTKEVGTYVVHQYFER